MARSKKIALVASLSLAGCTLGGLGDYDVATCEKPVATTPVQQVGDLSATADLGFTSASGKDVIGAFSAIVGGGNCIQGVSEKGFLHTGCSFLGTELSLVPRQPSIVPTGAGHAAAIVATTAPCIQGQLLYRFNAPGVYGVGDVPCQPNGVALPAVATANGKTMIAWYEAKFASREDPIGGCNTAKPAPLKAMFVREAGSAAPELDFPVTLSDSSIGMRSPAVLASPDGVSLVVIAPHAADVGVWTIEKASAPPTTPNTTVKGLAEARAVSAALAGDGSKRIGIAAEIGCNSHRIAFAVGTIEGGFNQVVDVAAPDPELAVEPSVSWSGSGWIVGWVSTNKVAHALARRFNADGTPAGDIINPALRATRASATASGNLLAFTPSSKSFVNTSLGCAR